MTIKESAIRVGDKVFIPVATGAGGALVANQLPQNQRSSKKALERVRKSRLSPIIKSDDPNFNHKAAQLAADLVMSMDYDEAVIFTKMVMADILDQDIEKNRRTLQRHLDEVVSKRIERIKKATLTTVAKGDRDDMAGHAQALALIDKAYQNPYETGRYQFDETDFRRDSRTGRFQTKVHVDHSRAKPLSAKQAKNLGIDTEDKKYKKMSDAQKRQYQNEYMQIANFLNVVSQTGKLGDHDVTLRVQQKYGLGNQHWVPLNGKPKAGRDWDPNYERVVAVEARPSGLTLGGASFGLVNSLSEHQLGRDTVRGINQADKHFPRFADDWSKAPTDPRNSNERLYNRVKSGSEFVGAIAPPGSKVHLASIFGQKIGEHGPQAERVLGPTARRTAYRYRGTEKTPDSEVVRQYDLVTQRATRTPELDETQRKRLLSGQQRAVTQYRKNKAARQNIPEDAIKLSRDEVAEVRRGYERRFMENIELPAVDPQAAKAGLAVLASHLTDTENRSGVPKKDLYRLQLESGNTPPSEGFLIDRNGKVVTQAVGYGDDHYLPFNLKHLKQLKGGEYIRSRSVGGPTSEDIYTGLMAGAKRVTVVSRSGTFTVDFADDFKGRRRYNDKAHRMVRRYEQLIDAVQSEQVDRPQRVSPEVQAMFAREVEAEFPGETRQTKREAIRRRVDEYKQEISSMDEEEFKLYMDDTTRDLLQAVGSLPEDQRRRITSQMRNDWQMHNEYKFKLNGFGYRDAMKSLEEQFPYYISTSYVPTREKERFEPEHDRGYVEPGRNRPTEAKAGLYGTAVRLGDRGNQSTTGGKFSASQADYQGATTRGYLKPVRAEEAAAPAAAPAEAEKPAAAAAAPVSVSAQAEERKSRMKVAEASANLIRTIKQQADLPTDPAQRDALERRIPALKMNDEELYTYFRDRENVRLTEEGIKSLKFNDDQGRPLTTLPLPLQDALKDYQSALGQRGRVDYDPKAQLTYSGAPFLFPGSAYQSGADPKVVQAEVEKLDRFRPVSDAGLRLSEMSESDLKNEVNVLMRVRAAIRDEEFKQIPRTDLDARKTRMRQLGIDPDVPGVASILEGENLNRHAKAVQQMRALNLVRAEQRGKPVPGEPEAIEPPTTRHLEERTLEDVQANKEHLANSVQLLQRAATHLAETEDPRRELVSNALYHRAEAFKEMAKRKEVDAETVRMITEASAPELRIAYALDRGNPVTEEEIEAYIESNDL